MLELNKSETKRRQRLLLPDFSIHDYQLQLYYSFQTLFISDKHLQFTPYKFYSTYNAQSVMLDKKDNGI